MQTWGVGIFDNDLALQARKEFEQALAEGLSVYTATERVVNCHRDEDDISLTLALAALQLEHELIHPRLKKKALTYIIHGDAADPWDKAGTAVLENRRAILHDLRQRLLAIPS